MSNNLFGMLIWLVGLPLGVAMTAQAAWQHDAPDMVGGVIISMVVGALLMVAAWKEA